MDKYIDFFTDNNTGIVWNTYSNIIEAPQRSSSPYGLNPVQTKPPPSPVNLPVKYSHVPQLEGHNIGLLVKTATEPLQQSMSASSSMLAATPPATPRSAAQPSPFEFPSLESGDQHKFRSLASFDEVQRDFNVNRSFDNVSPRPYLGIEGASPAHRFLYTPFVFVCQGVLPHDSIYINPNILRGDSVDLESWALRDYS